MAAEDPEMKLTETLHRSSLAVALLQATRDYDAAAIRARTSWDDHTAAWAEADRLREIRETACTRLLDALHGVREFDLDGKTYQIVNRIPVLVVKLPRRPARKRAAK